MNNVNTLQSARDPDLQGDEANTPGSVGLESIMYRGDPQDNGWRGVLQ